MITLDCPAKVNLFLSVGPVDTAGYHPINTVFCAISTCDTLTLARGPGPRDAIRCNWTDLPERNTVTRALSMAREYHSFPPLEITLEKSIPAESGLGGGSSDAAGLLRALRDVFPGSLSETDAQTIAAAVGADVPYFLTGGMARGEGYGDRITPLPDSESRWLVLARPDIGIATAEAYARLDQLPRGLREFPTDSWTLHNDFEAVAPCVCSELGERMQVHGCSGAQLSGSGSAVFGICQDSEQADAVAARIRDEFPAASVWTARTLSRRESLSSRRALST